LLDGTTAVGQSGALEAVRDGIRRGATPIDLRGYSHVLMARAQQPAIPVIGFLDTRSPEAMTDRLRAWRQGLQDTGHVEGETVSIVYRWADGHYHLWSRPDRRVPSRRHYAEHHCFAYRSIHSRRLKTLGTST
jgi:hypothetical protein